MAHRPQKHFGGNLDHVIYIFNVRVVLVRIQQLISFFTRKFGANNRWRIGLQRAVYECLPVTLKRTGRDPRPVYILNRGIFGKLYGEPSGLYRHIKIQNILKSSPNPPPRSIARRDPFLTCQIGKVIFV